MGKEEESKRAEKELNRIRKLPENRECANCLAPGAPLLTAVVMPFRIFVCSTCKSAHQSFSHRCKCSQMSMWTMDEVRALEDRNGGGNRAAQDLYLRVVRPSDRPKKGDSLDRYKDFVRKAYNEELWKSDSPRREGGRSRAEEDRRESRRDEERSCTPKPRRAEPEPRSERREEKGRALAPPPATASAGKAAPQGNLFDPDFISAPAPAPAPTTSAAPSSGRAAGGNFDGFDPNGPSRAGATDFFDPNPAARTGTLTQVAGSDDLFADFVTAPPSAPQQAQSPVGAQQQQGAPALDPFDPFASNGAGAPASPGLPGMAGAAISYTGAPTMPSQMQGQPSFGCPSTMGMQAMNGCCGSQGLNGCGGCCAGACGGCGACGGGCGSFGSCHVPCGGCNGACGGCGCGGCNGACGGGCGGNMAGNVAQFGGFQQGPVGGGYYGGGCGGCGGCGGGCGGYWGGCGFGGACGGTCYGGGCCAGSCGGSAPQVKVEDLQHNLQALYAQR